MENRPSEDLAISAMTASMWLLPKASFDISSLCSFVTVDTAPFSHVVCAQVGAEYVSSCEAGDQTSGGSNSLLSI